MSIDKKINSEKMVKSQLLTDKFAIALSFVCMVHCFFAPSILILTSGLLSFSIENEIIHKLILLTAIPISIFALCVGYKNHKLIIPVYFGSLGLFLLIGAIAFDEDYYGIYGESLLTAIGSILVISSHFINYKTCKNLNCSCHHGH
jgi:hypothetical protein